VADYSFLGLEGEMLKEWSYLDTFDMLAPRYDRPATLKTFRGWAAEAGLSDIEAEYTPHGVVLRAKAPPLRERSLASGSTRMCGIVGFQGSFHGELLQRMTDAVAHRGPDGEGTVMLRIDGQAPTGLVTGASPSSTCRAPVCNR
jgi:hypothetical protein